MPQTHAQSWWADVEHLREDFERRGEDSRRSDQDDLARRRAARERRREELEAAREALGDNVPRRRFAESTEPGYSRTAHAPGTAKGPVLDFSPEPPASAAPTRRTVQITGRTVPAPATTPARRAEAEFGPGADRAGGADRRRPARRPAERIGARPDRVAMWALLMGLMLILVAVGTADASTAAAVPGP